MGYQLNTDVMVLACDEPATTWTGHIVTSCAS